MKIILLGESFHGVKEFYLYKLAFLKKAALRCRSLAVVFETDYLGVGTCKHEQAGQILEHAFPGIFKTIEMKLIIQFLKDREIPFYGMDCRMRLADNLIPEKIRKEYDFNKMKLKTFGSSPEYFEYRDEFMAKKVLEIASTNDFDHIICLTHNLHVKIHGSEETDPDLKLKSGREYIDVCGDRPNRSACSG
jgi:erythromycin esterase-like protein